jgi:hypothetical protein
VTRACSAHSPQLAEEPLEDVAVQLAQWERPERRLQMDADDRSYRLRVVGSTSSVSK